ncbi:glycoside hydrolase superfamily [Phakopsora pachyrhizi]|uniref:Glycoside hydrolase superfamily n=1 Tax=Phakopsora pachyrhizi TaxID=170000 RepID=A0AAV0BER4_PHAPC|nr:glycoside hydrolase superfamily [Phakopsora pachyrhizi]CAH7685581.1 glycoside hydrolase superfamily [Phakopsora pachyrhizi]
MRGVLTLTSLILTISLKTSLAAVSSDCVRPKNYELKIPPLTTNWTSSVGLSPWPEYPRPQLRRESFLNLNGLWEFRPAKSTDELRNPPINGCGFDDQILVPFPMESGLSGIMSNHTLSWYRKTFSVPQNWTGEIKLNFGAVDYEATVFVNGQELGFHRGGYFRFDLNITSSLNGAGKENEILVFVYDPSNSKDAMIPIGKQALDPTHTFYTSSSGIWQTVFIEPVPISHVTEIQLNGDMRGKVRVRVVTNSVKDPTAVTLKNSTVKLTVFSPRISSTDDNLYPEKLGDVILNVQGNTNSDFEFKIQSPKLWSPETPNLYHVRVEYGDDVVHSYLGLRTVEKRKDSKGIYRTFLNGQSVFPFGTLDQGYWPDGIYTAPSFEAMQYDLKVLKQLGLNSLRKHVKIEPDLFYYACDRIGLLVFQDMPSMNAFAPWPNDSQQAEFERQLKLMVTTHLSFPSIIIWVIYNEGWGQIGSSPELVLAPALKEMDPTRLVIGVSGWRYHGAGDFHDNHHYPYPQCGSPFYSLESAPHDSSKIAIQGEFGGIGQIPDLKNLWNVSQALSSLNQTYEMVESIEVWNYRALKMVQELKEQTVMFSCAGAIYTQTTDVEAETNGLMTYDRRILRADVKRWKDLVMSIYGAATDGTNSSDSRSVGSLKMYDIKNP